ncbi:MAG: biopolymer transport protein ExbD [Myxococcota bacterium]|jgi:biopolymer transport protein ExbD
MTRQRRGEAQDGLDLVPIMNLVTILIPFMLMSSHLVSVAVLDASTPVSSEGTDLAEEGLELSVAITATGFVVTGNADGLRDGHRVPCEVQGCPPGSYDTLGLTARLTRVKIDHPEEAVIVLVPEPTVPYAALIDAMDAVRVDGRRELFPHVVVAGDAAR